MFRYKHNESHDIKTIIAKYITKLEEQITAMQEVLKSYITGCNIYTAPELPNPRAFESSNEIIFSKGSYSKNTVVAGIKAHSLRVAALKKILAKSSITQTEHASLMKIKQLESDPVIADYENITDQENMSKSISNLA